MSQKHFTIDANTLSTEHSTKTKAKGVVLNVSPSSYDVPNSVTIVTGTRDLTIDFEYLDSEEAKELRIDENLIFGIGKNSGKVLRISVKRIDGPKEAASHIVKGVEAQLHHAKRDNERMNYAMIKDLLMHRLRPELAGA